MMNNFLQFLQDNALTIQIVSGIVLVGAIGIFILMRMLKGGQDKNTKPPTSGGPYNPR